MTADPIDAALNLLSQQKAQAQEHIQQIQGQVEQAQRDIYAIDFAARVLAALRRDMQSAVPPPPDSTLPVMDTPAPQEYETHADYAEPQMPTVHIPEPHNGQDIPKPDEFLRGGITSRRSG